MKKSDDEPTETELGMAEYDGKSTIELIEDAAYCHHIHHLNQHSTNFYICKHPICKAYRKVKDLFG